MSTESEEVERVKIYRQPWWLDAVKSLGLPTVFLGVLLYMLYQAGIWTATEVVYPLFKQQSEFISSANDVMDSIEGTTNEIAKTINADGAHTIEILKAQQTLQESVLVNQKIMLEQEELLKKIADEMAKE